MKNSEWGAVAYLTHSQYGRNGHEIDINNSSSYITGNGGGSTNASQASGVTNAYNTDKGVKASSTGNIYGIYDLSGGGADNVSSYIGGTGSNSNGNSFAVATAGVNAYMTLSNKYATVYRYASTSASNSQNYTAYKNAEYGYGDAILETSTAGGGLNCWQGDECTYPYSSVIFFTRGYFYNREERAGIFSFQGSRW